MDEKILGRALEEVAKGLSRASKILQGNERKKREKQPDGPMDLKEFQFSCSKSIHPHIRILGDWAAERKPDCRTKEQWREYIRKNASDASAVSKFSDEQIAEGYKKLKEQNYSRPNLGTLIKMITR